MSVNPPSKKGTNSENTSTREFNEQSMDMYSTKTAAALLEKLKEFRQSYNRTHGQVSEFFEQAQVVEKLYNHRTPGKSLPVHQPGGAESDGEGDEDESKEEDECCTEQKTKNIKKKLNNWRVVMKEVVFDVCPNLHLDNQPDINPGLMKHVLDEIRKLKTELAFQHNTILELSHQLENHTNKNRKKDVYIKQLLEKSNLIRLNIEQGNGEVSQTIQESVEFSEGGTGDETSQAMDPSPESTTLQFGSMGLNIDFASLSSPYSECLDKIGKLNQQGVKGMDLVKKDGHPLVLVEDAKETTQQRAMNCNLPPGQKFFFDKISSKEHVRSCQPPLTAAAAANLDQKINPVESSIVCFNSIENKEGTFLDSKKTDSRSSIVVAQTPDQNGCHREDTEARERGRQCGNHLRRRPLMGLIWPLGFVYVTTKALRQKSRK
eukprot:g3162.t1